MRICNGSWQWLSPALLCMCVCVCVFFCVCVSVVCSPYRHALRSTLLSAFALGKECAVGRSSKMAA